MSSTTIPTSGFAVAKRMASIPTSGIRRIFDLAAELKDPIDFSMGQPDFDVPDPIKDAAIEAVRSGHNGYTVTYGIAALRDRIAQELANELAWNPKVLVTSGVSGGMVLALMTLVNPGDEVLVCDPCFVSYVPLIELCGGKPIRIDLYDSFQLDPDKVKRAITPRTKAMVLNSPGNPSGVVFSESQIKAVCDLALQHKFLIISDEIYNKLSYDETPTSPARFAPQATLMLRGFGKTYGMTGWRMGFAAGPEELINAMGRLQQYTYVCAPHPAQIACITAMDTDVSGIIDTYRIKRDLVVSELRDHFEFVVPAGGFFVYAKVPRGYADADAFVEHAIKNNVLIIPGRAFSARNTHFRISYAVDNDRLGRGCEILRSLVR